MDRIRFSPRPNRAHEINWQTWSDAAFARAQAEDKPILLSISAVWCHWCHVMDETSFSDSGVIDLINQHFVPVRVDSDQRPDINSRYNMGGWPTTAFLTPNGGVIIGATYMPAGTLGAALVRIAEEYEHRKGALYQQAEEQRARREEKTAPAPTRTEVDASIVDSVSQAVGGAYDHLHGGFGTQPKFPMVSAVELLLQVNRRTGDVPHLQMVEKTLDSMSTGGLYDHEEGGFFRYSTTVDWSVPHYEKMLEDNLGLLRLYLHGYLVTGRDEHALVASRIVDYLSAHLYDPTSGAFHGSQDADEEYYTLALAQRHTQGSPAVDPVFYSGLNAMAASAYLEASWVLNRSELKDVALGTLEFLLGQCRGKELLHSYSSDGESGIPALLWDFSHLVVALVDGYHMTGRTSYLEGAERLAGEMTDRFWDHCAGGFFDIREDPHSLGMLKVREKPMADNVPAIDALISLFHSTFKREYHETAGNALRVFVPVYREYGEAAAGYALAVSRYLYPPVEITVVGRAGRDETKALLHAAARLTYPHTWIKFMDSGDEERLAEAGYWPGDGAQAYVCLDTVCLAPIGDPNALHNTVEEFLDSRSQGAGGIIQEIGRVG